MSANKRTKRVTVLDAPPVLTSKRKRATVSYAEVENIPDPLSDDEDPEPVKEVTVIDSDEDDDLDFSVGRKTTKPPPKKKAKKASKPKKPKEQLPFRFLDLPPELRDMIYEMALVDPNGVSIVARTRGHRQIPMRGTVFEQGDYHYHRGRQHSIKPGSKAISPISTIFRPALLAVNKKINAEAVNYLYGHTFTFENCTALADFLAAIGPRNQQRLNTVKIVSWGSFSTSSKASSRAHNRSGLTMLAGATNLKALILACSISGSGATQKAQYLFREAHYFIAAYGAANGSKDAAVDIIQTNDFPVFIPTPSGRVCPIKEEQRDTFQKMLRVLAKTL